jgi:hypothetical protein
MTHTTTEYSSKVSKKAIFEILGKLTRFINMLSRLAWSKEIRDDMRLEG